MSFETRVKVRFADVDPAGIVFYPRYFEMLNGAVEDWFAQALGLDFRTMHLERHIGTPTVRMTVDFTAPGELGDDLTIRIAPVQIGRSSCTINALFTGDGRDRVRVESVLVCMDLQTQRSIPWPEAVRARMEQELATA